MQWALLTVVLYIRTYGTVRYGMVRFGMVWCCTVRYGMVWYGTVWFGAVRYGMVRYGTVWYGAVRYGMVWCCTVRYGTDGGTTYREKFHKLFKPSRNQCCGIRIQTKTQLLNKILNSYRSTVSKRIQIESGSGSKYEVSVMFTNEIWPFSW